MESAVGGFALALDPAAVAAVVKGSFGGGGGVPSMSTGFGTATDGVPVGGCEGVPVGRVTFGVASTLLDLDSHTVKASGFLGPAGIGHNLRDLMNSLRFSRMNALC